MTPTPDQIRKARKDAGWTVARMAAELGVTETSVYNWLSGRHPMPLAAWRLLKQEKQDAS